MDSKKSNDLLVIVHSGYDSREHTDLEDRTVQLVNQLVEPDILFVDEPIYEGVFLKARNRYLLAEALDRVLWLLSIVQFHPTDASFEWIGWKDDIRATQEYIRHLQTDYIQARLSHLPSEVIESCFEFLPADFVQQCIFRKRKFGTSFESLFDTIDRVEELSAGVLQKLWDRFETTWVFWYTKDDEREKPQRRINIEERIRAAHPEIRIFTGELEAGKIETDGMWLVPQTLSETRSQFNELWWPSFLASCDYRILYRRWRIITCWEYMERCVKNCARIISWHVGENTHLVPSCCLK